jgi:hypothetical protein
MENCICSRLVARISICALLAISASALRAGPPFVTDDPDTPGDKHWEINIAWTTEQRPGERVTELPLLDLNYGVGEHIQLKYEVPWLDDNQAGASSLNGLGNSLAGVKWHFLDADKNGIDVSAYPQFEFRNPRSSTASKGLDVDENAVLLPLEFQKEFGPTAIFADVGRVFPSKSDGSWFGGIVIQRDLTDHVSLGVELHAESTVSFDRSLLLCNIGSTIKLGEKASLLVSVGRELHNHFESKATFVSYLALQLHL